MSVIPEGNKKPGKIWYGYQRVKAAITERKKLGAHYVDAGVKSASAAVMFSPVAGLISTVTNISIMGTLSLPFTLAGAALGGGALFLTRNWIKTGVSELFHNRYTDKAVQTAETKWVEKKQRPGLFKRMGTSIKSAFTFGKKKPAEIDAPETTSAAPQLEAANQNYESGQQSQEFTEAATKPATPKVDAKAAERRQKRAALRNNHSNNNG